MPPNRYRGPPMTLANMRANGVRSLSVTCELCHHEATMNVDAFADATLVPAFGPRTVCTSCGIIGAFAQPYWKERAKPESPTGKQVGLSGPEAHLGPGARWPVAVGGREREYRSGPSQ
jgi:hypothetical protein